MKKIVLIFIVAVMALKASAQTPCTTDSLLFPKGTGFGISPDSLVGNANIIYSQTLQFKFPKDTTYQGFAITIDTVIIDSVNNVPKSLTYQCGDTNCTYLGGGYGCSTISGTPVDSEIGDHIIKIFFGIKFHSKLIPTELYDTLSGKMKLTIDSGTTSSIFDKAINKLFKVDRNYPNPFSETTEIPFTASAIQAAYLTIRNELGQTVYSQKLEAVPGTNSFLFQRQGLSEGMYFYSVQTGNDIITHSMVIKN